MRKPFGILMLIFSAGFTPKCSETSLSVSFVPGIDGIGSLAFIIKPVTRAPKP
ncbi:uncharacterized protein METZ01_LOCUS444401, partial [marine metagenome]